MNASAHLVLPLPADYAVDEVLAFHSRDSEAVSEQVDARGSERRLRKAVVLDGVPVLLDVVLAPGQARCAVHADGPLSASAAAQAQAALRSITGLRIDPAPFMAQAADDALMAPLLLRHGPLRIVQSASVFEALTWAIIGQQINLGFAIALRRSLIRQAGVRHSSGMLCYPGPQEVARIDLDALLGQKFSGAKAATLLRVARLVAEGALALEHAPDADLARTCAALLAIKGVGPWTVNYTLLRGYGHADCSLHGDVAIRTALQRLLQEESKPDLARTEALLARWAPQRTMAAAHLWKSLAAPAA
ncbi:DNA-3-methyladenine glycosylase family protein [Massilia sp. DWR3-1-1]|uniref:DNA-3-methyladenine glycosylase family protein n=1 Tax=Massilia sp. DWR3-1-1 TaxID=2804559 RepID=UPI003CF421F6